MNDASITKERFVRHMEAHRGIISAVSRTYCWDPELRLDLQQDMLCRVWRAYPSYRADQKFSTWMYRIVLNVAIDVTRKRIRERDRLDDYRRLNGSVGELADIEDRAREQLNLLERFLHRQNELNRAILMLYLEQNSHEEIADVVGITRTNVATKLSRLKRDLKLFCDSQTS